MPTGIFVVLLCLMDLCVWIHVCMSTCLLLLCTCTCMFMALCVWLVWVAFISFLHVLLRKVVYYTHVFPCTCMRISGLPTLITNIGIYTPAHVCNCECGGALTIMPTRCPSE